MYVTELLSLLEEQPQVDYRQFIDRQFRSLFNLGVWLGGLLFRRRVVPTDPFLSDCGCHRYFREQYGVSFGLPSR